MTRAFIVALALAVFSCFGGATTVSAQGSDSPEQVLQLWQAALDGRDYATYVECLHTGARQIPEYGSPEAMEFWADEIQDLVRKGFTGQFEIEVVPDVSDRFPPGALRAHPIVNGRPLDESLVLVQERGQWTILRIFS